MSCTHLACVPRDAAEGGARDSSRGKGGAPQDFVVCTGWHALCSESLDCQMNGDKARCNCARVDEPHLISTGEIQDAAARRRTLSRCTKEHPCEVDQAPICKTIKSGRYEVHQVKLGVHLFLPGVVQGLAERVQALRSAGRRLRWQFAETRIFSSAE
jgi:hypothetical protein